MAVGPLGQIHVSVSDIDRSVAFCRDPDGHHLALMQERRP